MVAYFLIDLILRTYLNENKIKISTDGKGRALDNIWIERLWRSVKYEDIYLKCYTTVAELEIDNDNYFDFYNLKRPHENLNYKTLDDMHNKEIKIPIAA